MTTNDIEGWVVRYKDYKGEVQYASPNSGHPLYTSKAMANAAIGSRFNGRKSAAAHYAILQVFDGE